MKLTDLEGYTHWVWHSTIQAQKAFASNLAQHEYRFTRRFGKGDFTLSYFRGLPPTVSFVKLKEKN